MFHPLHAIHVACRNGVKRGDGARMAFGTKPVAESLQHEIRTAKRGRGRHRDYRAISDPSNRAVDRNDLAHGPSL
jgi:hypothetical protein